MENKIITKFSPINNNILYEFTNTPNQEIDSICAKAQKAFQEWKLTSLEYRKSILSQILQKFLDNKDKIIDCICTEVSKPRCEAEIEVIESCDIIQYFLDQDYKDIDKKSIEIDKNIWQCKKSYIQYDPIGVYAVMKPWNYPFEMTIWSIIPILLAGNTIVYKPSEHTNMTGKLLYELIISTEIPSYVFNIIQGNGIVGKRLINNKMIDAVSFTGSTKTGKEIFKSNENRVKKLNLEMGGGDFAIVTKEADIDLAVSGLMWGAFANAGQVCVATEKILVHESIYNLFIDKFIKCSKELIIGKEISPLISKDKVLQTLNVIQSSEKEGCKILTGGTKVSDKDYYRGNYIYPTIIECYDYRYLLNIEELFSPIVFVLKYTNEEEMVNIVNSSVYGLGCSIWTENYEKYKNIINSLQVGMIWINEVNLPMPQVPWTGVKESAYGFNLSKNALYDCMNIKVIHNDFSKTNREWWYPY